MWALVFEELLFLTTEEGMKTGDVQANVSSLGHFYLGLDMLIESSKNIEGSAKHIWHLAKTFPKVSHSHE